MSEASALEVEELSLEAVALGLFFHHVENHFYCFLGLVVSPIELWTFYLPSILIEHICTAIFIAVIHRFCGDLLVFSCMPF